jgi:hypothetical protein
MSKQTAVEWYRNTFFKALQEGLTTSESEIFEQAKAMEKEQTEENMAKAITFGWELSQHHRLNTEEKLLQMQKDFITSVIEGGDK